jgi:hypothetical protein
MRGNASLPSSWSGIRQRHVRPIGRQRFFPHLLRRQQFRPITIAGRERKVLSSLLSFAVWQIGLYQQHQFSL